MSAQPSILFLDIDDVLCLNRPYGGYDVIEALLGRHEEADAVYREVFDRRSIAVLRGIHEALGGSLRYVISSTWREMLDREQLVEAFHKGGVRFVAEAMHEAWCTPYLARGMRVDEVAAWLDRFHRGETFAIVDDSYSGASFTPALANPLHPFAGRVVLCREGQGLQAEHAPPLLQALRRALASGPVGGWESP